MTRRGRGEDAWEDDGRTVVNMNVEGMPGYRRDLDAGSSAHLPKQTKKKELLSSRETRMVILAGMKWAFLYSMGFALIMVLFIIFCIKVWFA